MFTLMNGQKVKNLQYCTTGAGALYAADCKAERDAEAELYRRGYYTV